MADEKEIQKTAENMTDIEVGELAAKELQKRDSEIASLKKQLAIAKLYSKPEEGEEDATMSKEDCLKVIGDSNTCNYDYANAVCELCDREAEAGKPNPLGENGKQVYDFFKNVIEECDGDKDLFTSIYNSRLAPDDPSVALAYKKSKLKQGV